MIILGMCSYKCYKIPWTCDIIAWLTIKKNWPVWGVHFGCASYWGAHISAANVRSLSIKYNNILLISVN